MFGGFGKHLKTTNGSLYYMVKESFWYLNLYAQNIYIVGPRCEETEGIVHGLHCLRTALQRSRSDQFVSFSNIQ